MSAAAVGISNPASADTRLRGGWLVAARLGWVVVALASLAVFAASIPAYYASLRQVCTGVACQGSDHLIPQQIATLQRLGMSLNTYATWALALTVASSSVWMLVCVAIALLRSNDWMALLFSIQGITQGATSANGFSSFSHALEMTNTVWSIPVHIVELLNLSLLILFFALFPTGRFVPRWTRWCVLAAVVYSLAPFVPGLAFVNQGVVLFVAFVSLSGFVVGAQIYRYRHVSDPVQREQTRWLVFAIMVIVVWEALTYVLQVPFPALTQPDSLYAVIVAQLSNLVILVAPVCVVIAILRYRLWNIDVIIRRTLVYGSLTGILAAVYFGCVVATQAIAQALTGVESLPPVAIVASTLLIAALFTPLRRRLQAFIDRRFYRRKYDAAKTVAAFSAALRNEVDLAQLNEHLIAVVHETMQPEHVSLWLREPAPRQPVAGGVG